MAAQAELNMKKVEELAFRVVGDMGGAFIMALGYIGDRLGLYKAMDGVAAVNSPQRRTSMNAMCASGCGPWSPPSTSTTTQNLRNTQ